jgi:multiple sugar transport system permease protein
MAVWRTSLVSTAIALCLSLGIVLIIAITLLPFWVMVVTSLSNLASLLKQNNPGLWLHNAPQWQNYLTLFTNSNGQAGMATFAWNSLWIATITTLGHVLIAAMSGYAFARWQFPYKNLVFFAVLITLMIPPQVNIIPLFMEMSFLGLLDTPLALILPGLFGGFGVFLCRQWFLGFPQSLEEAATLDGCTPWQTFWHVALPTATPILITLGLFVFVASWNSFMWPLVAIHSPEQYTLPLGMANLKHQYRDIVDWPVVMAAATVTVLPVVGLFVAVQRWVTKGLMAGAVKG